MQITIDLPQALQASLTEQATQLNLPLETFILQALQQIVAPDPDDTPKAEVLAGLYRSLEDVKAGRISPVETLWDDGSDA